MDMEPQLTEWTPTSFQQCSSISIPWRMFLLNTGLMTPMLSILLSEEISAQVIQTESLPDNKILREVILKGKDTERPILYAVSEWNKDELDSLMEGKDMPIHWNNYLIS